MEDDKKPPDFERGARFWAIIIGLGVTNLLGALENTVVTTSAPTIVTELQLGGSYIWITNAFFVARCEQRRFQPLFGQLSNVFGRRWVTLAIVAIFTLGSGICGGATTGAMLITGRAVQGVGSGGIIMIFDIIVSDLVPLLQRGNYMAVVLAIYGVGTTLGPFIGGEIVETTTWRLVFYINLPIGGAALVLLYLALHIEVLVPLILGLFGFDLFAAFEVWGFSAEPVMPPRLFANPTSIIVSSNTFLNSALLFWVIYFLPVYFQAVRLYDPGYPGVALIPQSLVGIPGAAIAAIALSLWGRYKPLHFAGFAVFALGLDLLATFESVVAPGAGMVLNTQLPAFQAPVAEADQAAATAAWCFVRTFGNVWGVAIPAVVFNNCVSELAGRISDESVRELLRGGDAYQYESAGFIRALPQPMQGEVRAVYRDALHTVFAAAVAFAGFAAFLALFEKEYSLRTALETEFGLKGSSSKKDAKRAVRWA
ncbi:major facilitator superfamily domain-containing protein [Biscogniauxia marginata]|nr:major facilitator superfamily domain-containing protein [Biscogniauxia marginata]